MQTYQLLPDTYKHSFGQVFDTEAVVFQGSFDSSDYKSHCQIISTEHEVILRYDLAKDDVVYGMGQNVGSINKRGKRYVSYCLDVALHSPEKQSLYANHPFLIIEGHECFGLFIDYPGEMSFDIGFTNKDLLEIRIPNLNVDIYEFASSSLKQINRDFRRLIGKPYVPPRWGFGYQQCRFSYMNASELDAVVDGFRGNDIPCDTVYLDIDYMVDYKDFTIDEAKFPNFPDYVQAKKQQGIRLIPIIDAGIPVDDNYFVYQQGLENNYFCKKADGELFLAAVWPGICAFPDFLNPEVRDWWGGLYKILIDQGIEGFWNDMNEPSLFYTPERLQSVITEVESKKGQNLGVSSFFDLVGKVNGLSHNREDYKTFYHRTKDGETVNHNDVHNLYGTNMTRAAAQGFKQVAPEKRTLMFSRGSSIGAHRYAGIWLGDNQSWWDHLLLNIRMMPAVNMCGFLYSGADMGGFDHDCNSELMTRWTQFGIFSPLLRNHAAGGRSQEPFAFDLETTATIREHIKLRYALIPHLYSEFMQAVQRDDNYFWALGFEYNDQRSRFVDDQLLIGNSIMCAPVYTENARGRHVYLPESMLLWTVSDHLGREFKPLAMGDHWIPAELEQLPIFIRPNKMLPLTQSADYVEAQSLTELEVLVYLEDQAEYQLYHDDGMTHAHLKNDDFALLDLKVSKVEDKIVCEARVSKAEVPYQQLKFIIIETCGRQTEQILQLKA